MYNFENVRKFSRGSVFPNGHKEGGKWGEERATGLVVMTWMLDALLFSHLVDDAPVLRRVPLAIGSFYRRVLPLLLEALLILDAVAEAPFLLALARPRVLPMLAVHALDCGGGNTLPLVLIFLNRHDRGDDLHCWLRRIKL